MKTYIIQMHDDIVADFEKFRVAKNNFHSLIEFRDLVPGPAAEAERVMVEKAEIIASDFLSLVGEAAASPQRQVFLAACIVAERWLEVAENEGERFHRRDAAAANVIRMDHSGNFLSSARGFLSHDYDAEKMREYSLRAAKVIAALDLLRVNNLKE